MSKLRTEREASGLTREQLALKAETSTSTITRMELSGHIPSAVAVARIAKVLNVPTDYLLPLTTRSADAPTPAGPAGRVS